MRGARRPLVSLVLLLGRSALCGKVLTGEDMRAMGMGDLAGIADGDLSPDSIAALERRGVSNPGISGWFNNTFRGTGIEEEDETTLSA